MPNPPQFTTRAAKMYRTARHLGMQFSLKDENDLLRLLRDFQLFKGGRQKRIINVLHSTDDMMELDLRIFDYEYLNSSGKNDKYLRQTVFFLRSKKIGLPQMLLKPERFFNKIANYLRLQQDIDFEDFPEFSDQYLLQGEDEELVRYAMNEHLLKFFTVEKNWTLEGLNYFLVLYKKNKVLAPWQIEKLYKKGMKLHHLFLYED